MTDFDYRPGWPDAIVTGYGVMRTAMQVASHDEENVGLRWALQPALLEGGPWTMVVIGDLTIRTAQRFAGVQAFAYVHCRDMPPLADGDWEQANTILTDHAGWITHGLYDFAAQALRGATAGELDDALIPRSTPDHELDLAPTDAEDSSDVN